MRDISPRPEISEHDAKRKSAAPADGPWPPAPCSGFSPEFSSTLECTDEHSECTDSCDSIRLS